MHLLIPIIGLACLFPVVSPAMALFAGIILALTISNPYPVQKYTSPLLMWSVIGLGAGMNLEIVAKVGIQGIGYTAYSIAAVFCLGFILQKFFKVEDEVGLLITVGTAICGGSAIAAVTPVIKAKPHSVSVALGTVFILNALALLIFPGIGHLFMLSEKSFGLWSALAIHDTSSVVGATIAYGKEAAEVGTTVKLARALWIVPVTLAISAWKNSGKKTDFSKTKKPWFILGFLIMAAVVTWVPSLKPAGQFVEIIARRGLVLTLFLIGLGLSRKTLKEVGWRPLLMGFVLLVIVAVVCLYDVFWGVIKLVGNILLWLRLFLRL